MTDERADTFLRMIRRSQRGRLKVYLGYAAGVGKTYQMLLEAKRLKQEGVDVVIGVVETHGRAETAMLVEGLEVIPKFLQQHHGIILEEMDVQAILRRKPQVVLVDELAHSNVPGSKNAKRYEDVQDLLAAGIHVITTLNVQHLESLYNTVEKSVGVRVRERLPDSILAEADQIVNVDVTPEDLQERLKAGKIYPAERVGTAMGNFFKTPHLENLRELTLREMASQIDLRRHDTLSEEGTIVPDQIMVCLSSRGPNSELLLRYASRLAGKLNRNWYAVYVQTPSEEATVIDSRTQRMLSGVLTLAKELGAMVFTYKGEDIAGTILRFAREYQVGHIVTGSPAHIPAWKRIMGKKSIPEFLMERARGVTIVVLDTKPQETDAAGKHRLFENELQEAMQTPSPEVPKQAAPNIMLGSLLSESEIIIWDKPMDTAVVLEKLVKAACAKNLACDDATGLIAVQEREAQGSTFYSEGVAFPHARVAGLDRPLAALGLTRMGISDVATEKPIKYVFLSLSPLEKPEVQLQLLAVAARTLQNRYFLKSLEMAVDPHQISTAIKEWEQSAVDGGKSTSSGKNKT
ncbi:MAG: PTS sugar transporter subunit IIA [Deltaproteobacteria bacterium]|nr:PTS sugar transporter subunit IIA [Deltaproteobacteria bacterium]